MGKKARKSGRSSLSRLGPSTSAVADVQTRDVLALPGTTPYAISSYGVLPSAWALTTVEAAGIAAVRRCVTLIASAIAGRDWGEWEGTVRLPSSRIVRRPAALMSRREWVWRVVAEMALNDIAHLWMIGGVDDDGVPGSLVPIPRGAIHPSGLIDPWGVFPPTQYEISGVAGPISGEAIIPMRSAFWPGVPPHLVGVLQMARSTMMASYAAENYAARYWQHGGAPVTVITTEQELNQTQADAIGELWRSRRSQGPDFPAVLGKGATADDFGADVNQATAVEARREMVLDIGRLFGVSEKYLYVALAGSSQTYGNINDEALSLERFTLDGFVSPIEDTISGLLPGDEIDGRRMRIDLGPLTRAGQEARFRAWQIATGQKPWMVPSEVRTEEGLAPLDGIDDEPEPEPAPAPPIVETPVSIPAEPVEETADA